MNFFDMGPLEIVLILVVALIIWGPRRIPEIARTLGKTMRTLRKATLDITTAVTKEIDLEVKDNPSQSKANSDDKTKESSKESSDEDTAESSSADTASPRD